MRVTGSVDKRQLAALQDAIKIYGKATGKDLADILNRAGKQIAIYWTAHMPMADRSKIASELRRDVLVTHTKTGRLRKRPTSKKKPLPLAYAILLARAKKKGVTIPRAELEARANKMIAARLMGVGLHRAGNIPALREFHAALSSAGGAQQFGPPKGSGSLATPARLAAKLSNSVKSIRKIGGEAALNMAIADSAADLTGYAKKKLAARTAAANAGRPGAG